MNVLNLQGLVAEDSGQLVAASTTTTFTTTTTTVVSTSVVH